MFAPAIGPAIRSAISPAINRAALPAAFAELNLLAPTLDPRITFTRSSTKTYIGADGLLHTAAVNECPREYDPVTLQPVGMSFWEARTNLMLWSDDFTNGVWVKEASAIGVGSPGWSSVKQAVKLTEDTTSAEHRIHQNLGLSSSGTAYTCWAVAGPAERSIVSFGFTTSGFSAPSRVRFDLQSGIAIDTPPAGFTAFITPVGGGRFKFGVTGTSNSSATLSVYMNIYKDAATSVSYLGDGVSGIYLDAMQVEAAATPGPIIPTAASQVTRTADVASVDDLSKLRFNATAGTFYIEHSAPSGTVLLKSGSNTIVTSQGPGKIAVAYDASGSYITYNGGASTTGAALTFGSSLTITDSNAPMKRVRYYPRKLSDTERGSLTA